MKDIKWTIDKETLFEEKCIIHKIALENILIQIYKKGNNKGLHLEISRTRDHVVVIMEDVDVELRYAKTKILSMAIEYLNKKIMSYNNDLKNISPISCVK